MDVARERERETQTDRQTTRGRAAREREADRQTVVEVAFVNLQSFNRFLWTMQKFFSTVKIYTIAVSSKTHLGDPISTLGG